MKDSLLEISIFNLAQTSCQFNVKRHDRNILSGKELDIYVPKLNKAIEVNGNFWHSSKFVPNGYHLEKSMGCQRKNIHLLNVWEYKYKKYKEIYDTIIKRHVISKRIPVDKLKISGDGKVIKSYKKHYEFYGVHIDDIEFISMGIRNNQIINICTFSPIDDIEYAITFIDLTIYDTLDSLIHHIDGKKTSTIIDLSIEDPRRYIGAGFKMVRRIRPQCVKRNISDMNTGEGSYRLYDSGHVILTNHQNH